MLLFYNALIVRVQSADLFTEVEPSFEISFLPFSFGLEIFSRNAYVYNKHKSELV